MKERDIAEGRVGMAGARGRAREFLLAELNGELAVSDLRVAARSRGLAWRTVERAKAELGVRAVRSGRGWAWVLPGREASVSAIEAANVGVASPLEAARREAPPPEVKAASGGMESKAATAESRAQLATARVAASDEGSLPMGNCAAHVVARASMPCAYARHRWSDWRSRYGLRACGVCHPPAPGARQGTA